MMSIVTSSVELRASNSSWTFAPYPMQGISSEALCRNTPYLSMGNLVLGLAISGPSVERTIKTVDKPVLIATGIGTDEDYKHPPCSSPGATSPMLPCPKGSR